jgi:hypothetical protein
MLSKPMLSRRKPLRWGGVALLTLTGWLLSAVALADKHGPTVDELKARIAAASISDRPALCIELSELQLSAAGRLYTAGDSDKAKAALTDVAAFSELARDYAIQTHKHEKNSEIAIRRMVRKLADLKHRVTHDDQATVQNTIDRLQRVRDDLLAAMFPKANK